MSVKVTGPLGKQVLVRSALLGQLLAGFYLEKLRNRPSGRPQASRKADSEGVPHEIPAKTRPTSALLIKTCFPRGPVAITDNNFGHRAVRVPRACSTSCVVSPDGYLKTGPPPFDLHLGF